MNDAKLSAEDLRKWEKLYAEARAAHAGGDHAAALAAIDQAVRIDGLHADAHYLRGRILEASGRMADARAACDLALENDICPLRMLAGMRTILTEVAAARGGARGLERLHAARSQVPAVTHVDDSARVQTVDAGRHGFYHRLIRAFEALTGCPMLVNTPTSKCFDVLDQAGLILEAGALFQAVLKSGNICLPVSSRI